MAKKKNSTRKILILLGVLLVLVIVVAAAASMSGIFGGGSSGTAVEVADVELRTVTQTVTASGKIQPEVEVKISPDVSGEIIELPVVEGQQVRRGMLLARIRPDFYVAQVEQAEAAVLQAKAGEAQRRADLLNAQREEKRQKALLDSGSIPESTYEQAQLRLETAQSALEAAEYNVQSADARLSEAKENLAKTIIYAPMDGTISILSVEEGERVVGTSQMAGTEMMRVAKLDQMELLVDVNENDVVNVALGDTAAIEIDSYPDREFKGVVTEIANSARTLGQGTQEQITNFPVKIRILDPHNVSFDTSGADDVVANSELPVASTQMPNFRPGMSGTVDVFTHTVHNATAVPIQSVTIRDFDALRRDGKLDNQDSTATPASSAQPDDEESESTRATPREEDLRTVVFLMDEGHARIVEVETGITDDTHMVIISGLQVGEQVIIGPYRAVSRELEPGDAVFVQPNNSFRPPSGG